jgi:hypothetical protein
MNKILIIVGLMFISNTAFASCDFIKDNDQKYYCKAQERSDAGYCNFIKDSDLKYSCKAETTRDRNTCNFVHDRDKKEFCKSRK